MNTAQKDAKKSGSAIGNALSTGFKVGAAAAAAAAAAITGYLVDIGSEYKDASNQMAAATGATGKELENLQGVMREVYGNNYGDNMADIADAVATVNQQMDGLSDTGLQNVTEDAFILRDTFQYDIQESVRAANALVNSFGVSGEDAMNLIAAGSQNGLDFSGELLDTISEYSVQFAKVGLDANDMFNIMQAGADSGAWNLDKVGDAVKEMAVRVVDGSDTTAEGFAAIGLNANEMAQAFASGGDTAREAFGETVAALAKMEDPVQQNIAGVNLFGTMWEDLGPDVVKQLAAITGEAYATGDELSKIADVKYDNLGDALRGIKRSLEAELLPLAGEFTGFLTDAISNINFDGLGEKIGETIAAVQSAIGPMMEPLAKMSASLFNSGVFGNLEDAISGLQGPLRSLSEFLTPVIAAFAEAAKDIFPVYVRISKTMRDALMQIFSALSPLLPPLQQLAAAIFPALSAVIGAVGQSFISWVNLIMSSVMPAIQGLLNFLMPAIQAVVDVLKNVMNFIANVFTGNWSAAWDNIVGIFGSIWSGITGLIKAPVNGVIGIINKAIAAINSISVTAPDWVPMIGGETFGFDIPEIPTFGTGGTITDPTLAVVGDEPETIVPHGNTPRNRALLGEAAAGVGASGGIVVNFNVTIGGGDASAVKQGILDAEDEFERRMDAYFARKARVSFA